MTPEDIADRLDRVPLLAGRPRTVERLAGGLTNLNLRVDTPDGRFVVRLFQGDTDLLGIDRDAEHLNSRAAAEAGVGADVLDYRPDLGLLVIGWIDAETYDNASFARPGTLPRVAAALRALHQGPRFVSDFDMFTRQRGYLEVLRRRDQPLFDGYADHDAAFRRVRQALAVRAGPTVPCNNDLLAGNFLDDGERIWLIDYEYAGNNDACFELGNTATECDLDPDQVTELVTAYAGDRLRHQVARVRLQALVSAYGWALWGAIQASASSLDFDFTGWGRERFEKAAAGFSGPDFGPLLEEVRRAD